MAAPGLSVQIGWGVRIPTRTLSTAEALVEPARQTSIELSPEQEARFAKIKAAREAARKTAS
jgi:hypothetical protein